MTAYAGDGWADEARRDNALGRLSYWIAASIVAHVAVILFLLLQADPPPLTIGERDIQDRPAVEMVSLPPPPPLEQIPAPEARSDRPSLFPPPRMRQPRRLDTPVPFNEIQPIDPQAIEQFLARQALRDLENQGGLGNSWTACSLLSPERRAMEPACDGMLLTYSGDPARGALLAEPDAEILEIIRKLNIPEQARSRDVPVGQDASRDRSYRNEGDDVYGPRPWE